MDVAGIVEAGLSALASVAAAYAGHKGRSNGKQLERLRNGELNGRILRTVRDELATRRGDEIRDLMDAIIRHAQEED